MPTSKGQGDTDAKEKSGERKASSSVETVVAGERAFAVSAQNLSGTLGIVDSTASAEELSEDLGVSERYALVSGIARGGMGKVNLIFDRSLGRTVARKTALSGRKHGVHLLAEAQIGAQLEHPSIVPVYDVGVTGGVPQYTMRVVKGRTLRTVLDDNLGGRTSHVPLAQLLGILRQVCLAVDYAHSRGVIHRDLKPDNVIVGEFGEVYVLDWGVAVVTEDSDLRGRVTGARGLEVAGSPGYMAPEQALGEALDARTDVFALGVMLYEILSGRRPFEDENLGSILKRIQKPVSLPPSRRTERGAPEVFDQLVMACLSRSATERPPNARFIAEAIDSFLDGERARAEREREAEANAREGDRMRRAFEDLATESARLHVESEGLLAELQSWESPERKHPAWEMAQRSTRIGAEAARMLARAEAAYTRALGWVANHPTARAGLAALYFHQFLSAEQQSDSEKMAQYLDLARTYDDGPLELELADTGLLSIQAFPDGTEITVSRYEASGPLLRAVVERHAATAVSDVQLASGSYLVTARHRGRELRYPLMIERAQMHRLRLDLGGLADVPADMVLIPGGPFKALLPRANRLVTMTLPDFAIQRFPMTMGEYARFLDDIDAAEASKRTPGFGDNGRPLITKHEGAWTITPRFVEGEGRKRVVGRELDLPVCEVSWFDATAYARWHAVKARLPFRLPTDLEWEKAMRGTDGRNFPMGHDLDPSFAKLRASRPEGTQPEPVGAFPLDESPYGVRDMGGGVGDWTSTSVDGTPLPVVHDEGTVTADERQAFWRGGNWGSSGASRGMRYPMALRSRTLGCGFRLALEIPAGRSAELIVEPMRR